MNVFARNLVCRNTKSRRVFVIIHSFGRVPLGVEKFADLNACAELESFMTR